MSPSFAVGSIWICGPRFVTSEDNSAGGGTRPGVLALVSLLLLGALAAQGALTARGSLEEGQFLDLALLALAALAGLVVQLLAAHRSAFLSVTGLASLAVAVGVFVGVVLSGSESATPLSAALLVLNGSGLLLAACAATSRRAAGRAVTRVRERRVAEAGSVLPVQLVRLHLVRSLTLVLLLGASALLLLAGPLERTATVFLLSTLLFCWVFSLAFFIVWPMLSEESDRFRLESRLEAEAGRARRRFARFQSRRLG